MSDPQTIDEYLDLLADRLPVSSRRLRRILAEAEDHLQAATAELVEQGVVPEEAQQAAIERFGTPDQVARGFVGRDAAALWPLLLAVARPLIGLAAIGMLTIAASGVLSAGLGLIGGKAFISGDGVGVTYTAERCGDFFRLHPEQTDCAQAAIAHHYDELVYQRIFLGLIGGVFMAVVYWASQGLRRDGLPRFFTPTIGASVFGIVGCSFLGLGLMQTVFGGLHNGAGSNVATGIVAGVVCLVYCLRLLPFLLDSASTTPARG